MSRTMWLIVALIVVGVGYDVWTITTQGYDSTISAVLYNFAKAYPIVPFVFGIVTGHLWWPNQTACEANTEVRRGD